MPSKATIKKRGQPIRVRTKTLSDGTKLRVFIYNSKGKRGGRTTAEKTKVGGKSSGAKR